MSIAFFLKIDGSRWNIGEQKRSGLIQIGRRRTLIVLNLLSQVSLVAELQRPNRQANGHTEINVHRYAIMRCCKQSCKSAQKCALTVAYCLKNAILLYFILQEMCCVIDCIVMPTECEWFNVVWIIWNVLEINESFAFYSTWKAAPSGNESSFSALIVNAYLGIVQCDSNII